MFAPSALRRPPCAALRLRCRGAPRRATSMASPALAEEPRFTTKDYRRPAHWVLKVGDLRASLAFYEKTLGMKVHRHEEFASGCEATCNGPFGGAWSKTMVGYGSEATHFCLELTANYGVASYARGNDLAGVYLAPSAFADPASLRADAATGERYAESPDGYRFVAAPGAGVTPAPPPGAADPFAAVALNVSDLAAQEALYAGALGGRVVARGPGRVALRFGCASSAKEEAAAGAGGFSLELRQLPPGVALDRAQATGRLALETEDGAPAALAGRLAGSGATILHGPLVLQPHGEEVLIVQDLDGHETCFVAARGYRNCIAVADRAGGATVDWAYRDRLAAAAALTGDGAASAGVAAVMAGSYDAAAVNASIDAALAAHGCVVYAQTACKFCAKAKAALTEEGATFEVVDLDTLGATGHALRAELAKRTGRSSVPQVFVGGRFVGGYGDGPGVAALRESGELRTMLAAAGALQQQQ